MTQLQQTSTAAPSGSPAQPRRRLRVPGDTTRLLAIALVIVLAYLILWPLLKLQLRALNGNAEAYHLAFGRDDTLKVIAVTVALAFGSTLIAMVLGTGLALAASRLPARVRWLRTIPILPLVFPPVANVVGWAFLLSPGPGYLNAVLRLLPWWSDVKNGPVDVYTVPWIILLTGLSLTSFVYMFVSAGMANIDSSHVEAGRVAGAGRVRALFGVVLPLLRPSLVYGAGTALLLGLGQFTAPLLLGSNKGVDVLTTEMYKSVSESPVNYAVAAAFGSPLVLFGIAMVVIQRVVLGDQARFVTHGGKGFTTGGKASRSAAPVIIVFGVIAILLPLAGLIAVSISHYWTNTLAAADFTLDNFRAVVTDPNVTVAVTTSIVTAVGAIVIVIPLSYLITLLLLRGRRFTICRNLTDLLIALPLGVPAVVFGGGFLLTYTQPPFILYGTRAVLILVYVTLMLPFATRMMLTGLISLGESYFEASRVSGASGLKTTMKVVFPMLRGTIFGAVTLIFILLTHEFAASLLVRSATTQVMGTLIVDLWKNGSYPMVAAVSLVLTAITALGVGLAMLLGGRNILDKM